MKHTFMTFGAGRNEIRLITERLPNGNAHVRIFDQAGRLQLSQQRAINGQPVILPHHLTAGTYLIEIEMKGMKETQTFIVQ